MGDTLSGATLEREGELGEVGTDGVFLVFRSSCH